MQALAAGGNPAQIAASMAGPAAGMLNPVAGQLASGAMAGMRGLTASASPAAAAGAAPAVDDHPLAGQSLSDLASAPQFFVPGQTQGQPGALGSLLPF
ncbi:MAG: hypothetical protein IOB09_18910, partial [Burkholderia sp.]|nr:hypothetical protein [Burkholderia sp.]